MSIEALYWLVGFVLFQPLHLGMPLLYLCLYTSEKGRAPRIKKMLIDGILSSMLVFSIAAWFSSQYLFICVVLIVLSFPLPWLRMRSE